MSLASDLVSIPIIPDTLSRIEALVGDVMNFTPQQTFAAATATLTRKPSESSASMSDNAFTVDVPGWYTVTYAAGGFSRIIAVVAFPTTVLNQQVGWGAGAHAIARVPHLRGLVNDPAVTQAMVTATLEASTLTYVGLGQNPNNPPGWQIYGN